MTPLIAAHATFALISLLVGGYQLWRRPRGDHRHRVLGWFWVASMAFVATSSFAIRELRHGQLSLLHVLSVVTLVSLVAGVVAARRGNVDAHRGSMRGSWLGLLGAFVGAVAVPSRRIPVFVITEPAGAAAAAGAIVVTTIGLIALVALTERSPIVGSADEPA